VDELEILQAKCNTTEDPSPKGCYAVSVSKQSMIILLDHQGEGTINPPQLEQLFIYSATPLYKLNLWHTTLLYDMLKFSGSNNTIKASWSASHITWFMLTNVSETDSISNNRVLNVLT